MPRAFPEVSLEVGSQRFTLVFDWAAIRQFEREADMSIYELVVQAEAVARGGRMPKLTDLATALRAALTRHHPDVDMDTAMELFSKPGTRDAMFRAFAASQPEREDGEEGGEVDPSKRRRKK